MPCFWYQSFVGNITQMDASDVPRVPQGQRSLSRAAPRIEHTIRSFHPAHRVKERDERFARRKLRVRVERPHLLVDARLLVLEVHCMVPLRRAQAAFSARPRLALVSSDCFLPVCAAAFFARHSSDMTRPVKDALIF